MDPRFLAFLGIALVVILTPGPDMATVTKNALGHGRRGALLTSLGVCSGQMVHITAAALGLSAILRTATALFTTIKLAGAVYLIYLGVQAIRASRTAPAESADSPVRHRGSPYRQGLLSATLNPKLAVFFVTILPQFVNPHAPLLPQMFLHGAVFVALTLVWLSGYSVLVTRLRAFFGSPRVRRRMERITGAVLIGLGARLALERA